MNLDPLLRQFAFQRWYLGLLVGDIAEDQMAAQPGGVVNHPAWHLGHLAHVADQAQSLLGGTKVLDEEWGKLFAPNSTPVSDRSAYPTRGDLLGALDGRRAALVECCKSMTEAAWRQPHGMKPLEEMLPTKWHMANLLMVAHESTHLGQLATWRRAQGMPMALSRATAEAAA